MTAVRASWKHPGLSRVVSDEVMGVHSTYLLPWPARRTAARYNGFVDPRPVEYVVRRRGWRWEVVALQCYLLPSEFVDWLAALQVERAAGDLIDADYERQARLYAQVYRVNLSREVLELDLIAALRAP